MEYNKAINMMQIGDDVEGFYILKGAYPKVASNGRPFLNATLSDKTGAIEGTCMVSLLPRKSAPFVPAELPVAHIERK